ncbi:hypothetical protein DRQ50_12965 [bacterium]|nr:MAG: hypothetical protein DRQ50_12965 [bacterium]
MSRDPAREPVDIDLETSLQRLGVQDLQERLELSPLLAGDGFGDADGCRCTCDCDTIPDDVRYDSPMPDHGGFGTRLGPW